MCVLLASSSPDSEFDEGTRNLQLLWMNIQPSSCWIKIISLILCVAIHHPGQSHSLSFLYPCVVLCKRPFKDSKQNRVCNVNYLRTGYIKKEKDTYKTKIKIPKFSVVLQF